MAEQVNGSMTGAVDITGQLSGSPAVSNYERLLKKPQINGVDLIGNKTFEDLGMDKAFASTQSLQELQKKFDNLINGNEVEY